MAEALLLQDVEHLGEKGDVVDVSPGYLRNFLAPRKLAEVATAKTVEQAKLLIAEAERAAIDRAERAHDNAALLNKTVLTIEANAGEDGRLFGSITQKDIVQAIKDARNVRLDRKDVHIDEPIRQVGTYSITVDVHDGVTATVKTIVTAAE
ncbi:MAG: 50S ribosomal protein L9 [Thermoleophilaceae bacterium]|nr:50S ribosomal protein L9 [Thermoleophilaceae bacterium]